MRVVPEIFWEEETPQSKRLNFMIIKFEQAKRVLTTERNDKNGNI